MRRTGPSTAPIGARPTRTNLLGDAAALSARMAQAPPREAGEPLRWQDKARIVDLWQAGQTQEAMADAIGCHQSTVSRTITDLDDSRPFARTLLDANAAAIVQSILDGMKGASLAEKTKLLGKLDVVRDDHQQSSSGSNVVICIGSPELPLLAPNLEE